MHILQTNGSMKTMKPILSTLLASWSLSIYSNCTGLVLTHNKGDSNVRVSISIGLPRILDETNARCSDVLHQNQCLSVSLLLSIPNDSNLSDDVCDEQCACDLMSSALLYFEFGQGMQQKDQESSFEWLLQDNICNVVGFGPSILPLTNSLISETFSNELSQCQQEWQHYHLHLAPNHFTTLTQRSDFDLGRMLLEYLLATKNDWGIPTITNTTGIKSVLKKWKDAIQSDTYHTLPMITNSGYVSIVMRQSHLIEIEGEASNGWTLHHIEHNFSPFDLPIGKDNQYLLTRKESSLIYTISSTSALDPSSRGLHRRMNHNVFIGNSSTTAISQVELVMLFQIESGLFIDVDELFSDGYGACHVTISSTIHHNAACHIEVLLPPRTIDIEQPAFVSPQNTVGFVINIDFKARTDDNSDLQQDTIAISFATNIHFRYPIPVSNNSKDDLISVKLPYLEFFYGRLTDVYNKVDVVTPFKSIHSSMKPNDFSMVQAKSVTSINAGSGDDYYFVEFISITIGICGAFFMMKRMSDVTIWV